MRGRRRGPQARGFTCARQGERGRPPGRGDDAPRARPHRRAPARGERRRDELDARAGADHLRRDVELGDGDRAEEVERDPRDADVLPREGALDGVQEQRRRGAAVRVPRVPGADDRLGGGEAALVDGEVVGAGHGEP